MEKTLEMGKKIVELRTKLTVDAITKAMAAGKTATLLHEDRSSRRKSAPGERRVAATPETIGRLKKLGFEVLVESQAGAGASFCDEDYRSAGATVVADTRAGLEPGRHRPQGAAARACTRRSACTRPSCCGPGATLISFLWPGKNKELVERLAAAQGRPRSPSIRCRASRARRRWTRCRRWPTSPAIAR